MKSNHRHMLRYIRFICPLTPVLLTYLMLAGCSGYVDEQGAMQVPSAVLLTETPSPTSTFTRPQLDATKVTSLNEERATAVAATTSFAQGTPYPPSTPIIISTSGPMRTPILGITGNCADANPTFDFGNCWSGLIDNDYLFVDTGAFKTDPSQGVIKVYTRTLDLQGFGPRQWFSTPSRVGSVSVTDVTWPHMTLIANEAEPSVTFVFDLSTRQWVSPPPIPTPSLSVPPLPTLSPGLSPVPSAPPLP